ncbi:MAG: homoserine kinase [Rhodospirillales bacterium]|nr:MAG: homoserine kinase [Rhodospirillales bacterium]
MAVYTEVSDEELAAFAAQYDIGDVQAFKGIAEGVENSNYLLAAERGQFILTLYEKRTRPEDLPFFLGLMEHLAARGLACPTPIHGRDGQALRQLSGKPAAMVSFLKGMSAKSLQPWHCQALGQALGQLHLAGADFKGGRANALSVSGWRPLFEAARCGADQVAPGLERLIGDELDRLEAEWPTDLPKGVIHADLFPDNVFFLGDKLSGLIDFYFACTDFLAYDIAVCVNAWCFEKDLSFNATKARLLLGAYEKVRRLDDAEVKALPLLCRGAAMRFLLTRLYDWLNTPEGALVTRKDPREYLKKLRFHQGVVRAEAYGLDAR